MKRLKPLLLILILMVAANQSHARVTTLSGGVTTSYNVYDREYANDVDDAGLPTDDDGDDYSRIVVSPSISIVSEGIKDTVDFSYTPSLPVIDLDNNDSDNDIGHHLTLGYNRALTNRWNITLSNAFVYTDDHQSQAPLIDSETGQITSTQPGENAVTGDRLSDVSSRRSRTTNTFRIGTTYTYQEASNVAVHYAWTLLRNDDDVSGSTNQDYDRHAFDASVNHRFNQKWSITGSLGYTIGLFDDSGSTSDDVDEFRANIGAHYNLNRQHTLTTIYNYSGTDYEAAARRDREIHDITLGWQWSISPRLNFSIGGGPTYSKTDGEEGTWDSNGNLVLNYQLQRGSLSLSASGGQHVQNYTGTNERRSSEFWQIQARCNYSLFERVSLTGYATYDNSDAEEAGSMAGSTITVNTKRYGGGLGLSYMFHPDWSATLSYDYTKQESDDAGDEYDDHAVTVGLSYKADFLRW
ncbi:MAG: hypothetical protein CSB34_04855 [Desulfobulbus propionicus]|nr:MAG: hypothetical protein CSB34_04855 [Desulfobulbus propionicus]PIE63595.1 MAG: hypothetical protein CSA26_12220 [Desulfobacterales bacterium]